MHENNVSHSVHIKNSKDGGVGNVLRISTFGALVGVLH